MKNAKEIYMYLMGALVVLGGFAIAWLLIFYPIPESNNQIVTLVVGLVFGNVGLVIGYFFGSSKSSADKNEIMAKQTEDKAQ